jgi:hypothetical protein
MPTFLFIDLRFGKRSALVSGHTTPRQVRTDHLLDAATEQFMQATASRDVHGCGLPADSNRPKESAMLGMILLVLVILLLLGALPAWGHSRQWGYGPSGGLGLLVVVLLVLVFMGRI